MTKPSMQYKFLTQSMLNRMIRDNKKRQKEAQYRLAEQQRKDEYNKTHFPNEVTDGQTK